MQNKYIFSLFPNDSTWFLLWVPITLRFMTFTQSLWCSSPVSRCWISWDYLHLIWSSITDPSILVFTEILSFPICRLHSDCSPGDGSFWNVIFGPYLFNAENTSSQIWWTQKSLNAFGVTESELWREQKKMPIFITYTQIQPHLKTQHVLCKLARLKSYVFLKFTFCW